MPTNGIEIEIDHVIVMLTTNVKLLCYVQARFVKFRLTQVSHQLFF